MDEEKRQELFDKYYIKHGSMALSFIRGRLSTRLSHFAEDIAQQVYLNVWNGLPTLKDEKLLGTWSYRVMKNVLSNFYRANINREVVIYGELFDPRSAEENEIFTDLEAKTIGPDREIAINEFLYRMDRAIETLGPSQKNAISAHLMNYSTSGSIRGGVKRTPIERRALCEARRRLRVMLKKRKELLDGC